MTQTPEDPGPPDSGGNDQGQHHVGGANDWSPPPIPPNDGAPPAADPFLAQLPPLDAEGSGRRRFGRGRGLLAVTVLVLALVGGGMAVALGDSDGKDDRTDGVASIDGSTQDTDNDGSSGQGKGKGGDDQEMEDAMLAFAKCIREHGVDMPDPTFDADGGGAQMIRPGGELGGADQPDEKFEEADKACSPILEEARGDMEQPSAEDIAKMQDQMVKMAECMRERGYDMPDPEVSPEGRVTITNRAGAGEAAPMDPTKDEQFQKDQSECSEEAGMSGGEGPRAP